MRLIFDRDEEIADWVAESLGVILYPPFTAIGAVDEFGIFRGGAVFNEYNGFDVSVTIAGDGIITRGNWRSVIDYVFNQSGCLHMSAKTRRSNKLVQSIAPRLGFKFVAVLPQYYGPDKADDAIMYRLSRADAYKKWKIKDGINTLAAAGA
jgi:hypothetical protein